MGSKVGNGVGAFASIRAVGVVKIGGGGGGVCVCVCVCACDG